MGNVTCCYKCPDRVAEDANGRNCHGYCEKYLKQKKENEEANKKLWEHKERMRIACGYR